MIADRPDRLNEAPERSLVRRLRASITIHALLEFAVAIAAIVVFVEIAEEVVERHADAYDEPLAQAIRSGLASELADAFFGTITYAGSWPTIVALTVGTAGFALYRRHRRVAGIVLANAVVALALNELLKALFARHRPNLSPAIPLPSSYSFPSGHAMISMAVYGALTAVVVRLVPRARLPALVTGSLLILAIGLSRVYLGVHWPLDVIAGYAAALPLVAVTVHLMRRFDRGR